MGNCPLIQSFPIRCCKNKDKIILSYRYDDYNENKDENIIEENLPKENINNIFDINDNLTFDKDNSISSKKNIKNNFKFKYLRLLNLKSQLTIEEYFQLNKFNSQKKNLFNQATLNSNLKLTISKQTLSTTNSAQKLIFNLTAMHEDEIDSQKKILINILKKNLYFRVNFNDNQLEKLIFLMNIYEIKKDENIFNKENFGNSFFIIESGDLYIFNNILKNNDYICHDLLINGDYCFGELCLLNEKNSIKRKYSIKSLSLINLYFLNKDKYFKFLNLEKIVIQTIDINIIQSIEFLAYLNPDELFYFSKLSYIIDENKDKNHLNLFNNIIYLNYSEFVNFDINLNKIDIRNLFLKLQIPNNSNKFLIISIHSLIEIFGMNFRFVMIFRIFYHKLKEDLSIFKDLNNNYIELITLYSAFKYNYNKKESLLEIDLSPKDNYYILILQGKMQLNCKERKIKIFKPYDYINTNLIENKIKMIFSINSIILYAKNEEVIEKINKIKEDYSLIINKIYKSSFLCLLNDEELLFFLNNMKIMKYKKDEIIINNDNNSHKFYFIIKGNVKHKSYNNKTIQKYSENCCFGEIFLLDEENNNLKDNYVYVVSESLITAEINREDFFILINNPKINDFIKLKISLEDKSFNLDDLYYLQNLEETRMGNLYLVHNGVYLYAIKSISKSILQRIDNEKSYSINKINILKSINYKFISKMINKFKNDKWYFILMQYSNGIKLSDAIKYFPKNNNLIKYIKFYSSIIFLIIDYLHNNKIIHRDIKLSNFIIENDGYLKLIDVGSAKKILNGYAKTILGTPHYMAPEIIEGNNYSFPSDYYSIGISLYYLLYNEFPFGKEENDVYKIYQEIINSNLIFKEDKENKNNDLNELISKLLIIQPNTRYSSINTIKSNIFYKEFNWDLLFSKKIMPPFIPKIDEIINNENILNDYRISFESFIKKERDLLLERKTSLIKIENDISEGVGSKLYKEIDILNEEF